MYVLELLGGAPTLKHDEASAGPDAKAGADISCG
jgi:hypothetical protein